MFIIQHVLPRPVQLSLLLALSAAIPENASHAQGLTHDHQLAVLFGRWNGDDFIARSVEVVDPVVGAVVFRSALRQGNGLLIGVQYTGYFSDWLALEAAVGYSSNEWTAIGGRVENGSIVGTTEVLENVATVPFSLSAMARLPLSERGPNPFLSIGAGGVNYQFGRSNAPLRINLSSGPPIDTVLFDVNLGLRFAPNLAAGVLYRLTDKIGIRLEGRLWLTVLREQIADEYVWQKNTWLAISTGYVF